STRSYRLTPPQRLSPEDQAGHRDGRACAAAARAHTRNNREQQVNPATTCVVVRHLFACVCGAHGRSVMNRYPWRLLVVALVTVASVAVLATPPVAAYPAPAGRLAPVTSPGVYRPVQQRLGQPEAQPSLPRRHGVPPSTGLVSASQARGT